MNGIWITQAHSWFTSGLELEIYKNSLQFGKTHPEKTW